MPKKSRSKAIVPAGEADAAMSRNKKEANRPGLLFDPSTFRWSMLGTRERRAMTVLVDHVAECRIAHRLRLTHRGKAVITCEFPGCEQMCQLLWHNLSCKYWGKS
jgi:hypothetical protein